MIRKKQAIQLVRKNGFAIYNECRRFKNNSEVMMAVVQSRDWYAYKHAGWFIKRNRRFSLQAVGIHGKLLEYISGKLQNDRGIVEEAVRQNGGALVFASKRLRDDKEIALLALEKDSYFMDCISKRLKDDDDIMLKAFKHGHGLQHASGRIKDMECMVLDAVRVRGCELEYASQRQKRNRAVAIEALIQDKDAIHHVDPILKEDGDLGTDVYDEMRRREAMQRMQKSFEEGEICFDDIAAYWEVLSEFSPEEPSRPDTSEILVG